MPVKTSQHFVRYVLWADAISCLACGLLQVTLTSTLNVHLGLSQALLSGTGVFLLLWSAMVAFFATLIYALRLRAKMASVSKAQFAFAACATLASLF